MWALSVNVYVGCVKSQHLLFGGEKKDPLWPISTKARANLAQTPTSFTVILFFQLSLIHYFMMLLALQGQFALPQLHSETFCLLGGALGSLH